MENTGKPRGAPLTTHTASSGVRATEELTSEPVAPLLDSPALQGTHGNYDVGDEIARGGMGRIVEARDRRHDRPVALKLLLRKDAISMKRFAREAWITGRLQHPAIIPLYEAGRWETGEPYFAMKLVRGGSLAEVLRSKKTHEERIGLLPHLIAVTEALAYAHEEGVVHRDLKPSNVLVGSFGETVVIDWGLAKRLADGEDDEVPSIEVAGVEVPSASLTAEGNVVGTPNYMPPEQARGERVDARADVYALGACIYHALSGVLPYGERTGREAIARLLVGPPSALAAIAPEVPADLAAIVAKAMARDLNDRYATAKEMAEDLRRFSAGRLVSAHSYTPGQLVRRWVAKRKAVVLVAAAALVTVAVLAGVGVRRITRERDSAKAARVEADAQRQTAVVRRDAAEKLIDSLVGDLRAKLVPIGRLDVMAALGEKVLEYYRTVSPGDDVTDAGALARRAKAIGTLAGVSDVQKQVEPAIRGYQEAIALCDRAIAQRPQETEGRRLKAWYLYRVALCEHNRDRLDDALTYFDRSLAAFSEVESLLTEPSALAEVKARHALVFGSQAESLLERGDLERADSVLTGELAREEREASGNEETARGVAWARLYRARVRAFLGDLTGATSDARLAFDARARVASVDPSDKFRTADTLAAREMIVITSDRRGDYESASSELHRIIDANADLVETDPENINWLARRGDAFRCLCDIDRRLGIIARATKECELAKRSNEELLRRAPGPFAIHLLAQAKNASAATLLARQDAHAALLEYVRSGELIGGSRGLLLVSSHDDDVVDVLLGVARAEFALDDLAGALRDASAAQQVVGRYVEDSPHNVLRRDCASVADLLLGDVNLARRDVASARDAYAHARDACVPLLARAPDDASARLHCAEADAKLAAQTADASEAYALRAHAASLIARLDPRVLKTASSELPGVAR